MEAPSEVDFPIKTGTGPHYGTTARSNSAYKPKSLSDDQRKQHIIITECLCEHCTGQYTDTLTQSLKVVCTDPKHSTREAKHCPEVGRAR